MKRQIVLASVLAGVLGMGQANAQDPDGADQRGNQRGNQRTSEVGVARMSVADGEVQVLRGDTGDRMQARGGMALGANDSVFTGRSSRAEVQLGPGNLIRLNEEAEVRIVDIGNRYFRVEVRKGGVSISQLRGGEADIDVMTPNTTVRPLKTGVYRVAVREGGQTDLTVRKGEAEIISSRGGERVKSGQLASVRGERQSAELRVAAAEPKDSFDRWNERRDDVLEPRYQRSGILLGGGLGYPYGGLGYGGFGYPFWGPGFYGGGLYGGGYGFGPSLFVGGRVGGFGGGRRGGRR